MTSAQITSLMSGLPENATNGEALAWVERMRRIVDRWDDLPGSEFSSMTPELKKEAHDQLDKVAQMVQENMALPEGA